MSRPVRLPIYGKLHVRTIRKEDLLAAWNDVIETTGVTFRTGVEVRSVTRGDDGVFDVETSAGPLRAQRVVLAIGRRGTPRKLGIPGEDLAKVAYRLLEPEQYRGTRCLVVGGGDAGVEAAISLGEEGATVHLAHRRTVFDRIKARNQKRLDEAVEAGRVRLLLETKPTEIRPDAIGLEVGGRGPGARERLRLRVRRRRSPHRLPGASGHRHRDLPGTRVRSGQSLACGALGRGVGSATGYHAPIRTPRLAFAAALAPLARPLGPIRADRSA